MDLWGDPTDPWSWLAKRRLEEAVARSSRPADVTVVHHTLPRAPLSAEELQRASVTGRPDGLDITLAEPSRGDTKAASRLVALAHSLGGPPLQAALLERLFAAVFTEGADIASNPMLQRLAAEAGLDERRVGAVLASEELSDEVDADVALAAELGIEAPPFAVVGGRVGLGGVASVEDYLGRIESALPTA